MTLESKEKLSDKILNKILNTDDQNYIKKGIKVLNKLGYITFRFKILNHKLKDIIYEGYFISSIEDNIITSNDIQSSLDEIIRAIPERPVYIEIKLETKLSNKKIVKYPKLIRILRG
jgi:hypothetical protein